MKIALIGRLAPAAIVVEVEIPLTLKPGPPVMETWENVSVALPVFFSVMLWELLVPTTTLPKPTEVGFADPTACVPVPLKAMVAGDPGALLEIETLPEALPETVGVNVAVKVAFPPAAIVWPTERPVILNPGPEALDAEIVRVAFPVFVRVIVCGLLAPTATLPKFSLAGLITICACVVTAVPLRAIVSGEVGALLVIVIVPVGLPLVVGANLAVNDAFCPAAITCPAARPPMLYPVPVTLAAEIVVLAVPEFVKVTDTVALALTSRLPKLMLVGLAERAPCVPVPVRPMFKDGFEALLVTAMLPDRLPAVVGANFAVKVALPPALITFPAANPLMLKPAPLAVA